MEFEHINGVYNLMPNETLARIMHSNLSAVGGVIYNAEERQFAEKIFPSLNLPNVKIESAAAISPFEQVEERNSGSTDVGDISWVVSSEMVTVIG